MKAPTDIPSFTRILPSVLAPSLKTHTAIAAAVLTTVRPLFLVLGLYFQIKLLKLSLAF